MARVLVYQRAVDAVLSDVTRYDNSNCTEHGPKVKEEPPDPQIENSKNSASINASDNTTIQNGETVLEEQSSLQNFVYNKENKNMLSKSYENSERESSGKNVKKRKHKTSEEGQAQKHQEPTKKRSKRSNEISAKDLSLKEDKNVARKSEKYPEKHVIQQIKALEGISRTRVRKPRNLIECDVCFVNFPSEEKIARHKLSYSKPLAHVCDLCGRPYSNPTQLGKHKENCSQSLPLYNSKTVSNICHFCSRCFTDKKRLQAHLFHYHADLISKSPKAISDKQKQISPKRRVTGIDSLRINGSKASKAIPCKSESLSPVKKMRQTTLNKFLILSNGLKKESISPEKRSVKENIVNRSSITRQPTSSGSTPNSLVVDGRQQKRLKRNTDISQSSPNLGKPFVHIHANPSLIKSLLNARSPEVKTESRDGDSCNPSTSFTCTYSLRRTGEISECTDNIMNNSHHPNKPSKYTSKADPITPKSERLRKKISLWESKMKSSFHCKECMILLVRCDGKLNSDITSQNDDIQMQVSSKEKHSSCSVHQEESTEHNSPSGNSDVSATKINEDKNMTYKKIIDSQEQASLSTEKPVDVKTFKCNVCKRYFSSKENLKEHVKLFHIAYVSSVCSARYTSRGRLLDHYLRQHAVVNRKECFVCRETFSKRLTLKQHLVTHCTKVVRSVKDHLPIDVEVKCQRFKKCHKCNVCGKRFWISSCLVEHRKFCLKNKLPENKVDAIYAKEEPEIILSSGSEKCNDNKSSPNKPGNADVLIDSQSTVHSQQLVTPEVTHQNQASRVMVQMKPVEDVDRNTLMVDGHITASQMETSKVGVVQNASPIDGVESMMTTQMDANAMIKVIYPCPVCGKQFQTAQNLLTHQRYYSRDANNICITCGTGFPTRQLLRIHVNATHNPSLAEKFKIHCRFCYQGFHKKSNIRVHEMHLHSEQIAMASTNSLLTKDQIWNINLVCNTCNLMFETYDRFVEHNMYYYKAHVFTCTFCGQTFQGLYMLHHHNKLMHYPDATRKSYTYTCNICNEGFTHESHFHAHKLHVHLSETQTTQSSALNMPEQYYVQGNSNVVATETKQLPINAYTCGVCNLHFTNKKDLDLHEIEFSVDGDFQCGFCDRKCSTAAVLSKHLSLNHTGYDIDSSYKCRLCQEVVTTSTSMMCHVQHFHKNGSVELNTSNVGNSKSARNETYRRFNGVSENLMCLTCGMRFAKEVNLKEHLLEYSDIGAYTCDICHRKFAELHRLEMHKIKHSRLNSILSEHYCPICHEGFASVAFVRTHVLHLHGHESFPNVFTRRTNDVKSGQTPDCVEDLNVISGNVQTELPQINDTSMSDITSQNYRRNNTDITTNLSSTNSNLQGTGKNLTAENLNTCSDCGLMFDNRNNLMKHIVRYKDSGDYTCEICGRRFPWERAFQEHHRKHFDNPGSCLKHKCPHCEERFRTPVAAHSHVVHLHGKTKPTAKDQETVAPRNCVSTVEELYVDEDIDLDETMLLYQDNSEDLREGHIDPLTDPTTDPLELDESNDLLDSTVSEEKSISFTCPVCATEYSSLKNFKRHFTASHPNMCKERQRNTQLCCESDIQCIICDCTFTEEQHLKEHLNKMHKLHSQRTFDQTITDVQKSTNLAHQGSASSIACKPKASDLDDIEIVWENEKLDVSQDIPQTDTLSSVSRNSDNLQSNGDHAESTIGNQDVISLENPEYRMVGKLKVRSFAYITSLNAAPSSTS